MEVGRQTGRLKVRVISPGRVLRSCVLQSLALFIPWGWLFFSLFFLVFMIVWSHLFTFLIFMWYILALWWHPQWWAYHLWRGWRIARGIEAGQGWTWRMEFWTHLIDLGLFSAQRWHPHSSPPPSSSISPSSPERAEDEGAYAGLFPSMPPLYPFPGPDRLCYICNQCTSLISSASHCIQNYYNAY